jgi:transcriptional regulator with XRE-family HTH domain
LSIEKYSKFQHFSYIYEKIPENIKNLAYRAQKPDYSANYPCFEHFIVFTENDFPCIIGYGYENMAELCERIKELRSSLKLSQRQFARRIFVSQALVHEIELGKRKIHTRILHLISSQFSVNMEWLKKGEGDMFSGTPQDARLEHIIEIFHRLDKPLQDYLLLQSKELLKIQNETIDKIKG